MKNYRLEDIKEGFRRMPDRIDETVNALQIGTNGSGHLVDTVEELAAQFESVHLLTADLPNMDESFLQQLVRLTEDTNRVLNVMLEAMAGDDIVLVTDLLQYEVKPRMERWLQFLAGLEKSLN